MTDAILAILVLAPIAAIAVGDARRALVDPRMVLALLGAAAAWRFLGSASEDGGGTWQRLAGGVLGMALGVGAAMVPIALAAWLGRRWPLYPGDAMMLGAFGFLLGVPGLAWAMLLGCGFGLVHRFWLQRRRGRPFRKGLVPLGPGMCAGAAVVFVLANCGVALAGGGIEDREPVPAVETALLPAVQAMDDISLIPATELGPVLRALPAGLAGREVAVDIGEALPFPALVGRLAAVTGVAMRIEERASRIAGGRVALADPPPLRLAWRGTLAGLLDRVAALSGYQHSWDGGAVVFQRYWDVEQRMPSESVAGPGGPASGSAGSAASAGDVWAVDPTKHRTLRGVLESWGAQAGWTVVWTADRDYVLGAPATFRGGFLEAADLLLSGPATSRTLDARAYEANRHLVVDDADGAGW
ncbi:MAG: TcpQ domain-containing protein [Alphaproteobacteria bacterium]|nr:TcpQ domain-containing protein [Alphaproteobacteria bacterium]